MFNTKEIIYLEEACKTLILSGNFDNNKDITGQYMQNNSGNTPVNICGNPCVINVHNISDFYIICKGIRFVEDQQ